MLTTRAQLLWCVTLVACFIPTSLAAESGEYPSHTEMPPVPTDPADYENMWDPYVLRASGDGAPLEMNPESDAEVRTLNGFDALPWNGRQIVRDASGNWFVAVEQQGGGSLLATGAEQPDNPYRPRGGDLATIRLVGAEDDALFSGQGDARRVSMAIDGDNHLHVIWHTDDGLWHTETELGQDVASHLRDRAAWTTPTRLVDDACRPGDIMAGPDGAVVVSYSSDDTVYYQSISAREPEIAGGPSSSAFETSVRGDRIPMSERE